MMPPSEFLDKFLDPARLKIPLSEVVSWSLALRSDVDLAYESGVVEWGNGDWIVLTGAGIRVLDFHAKNTNSHWRKVAYSRVLEMHTGVPADCKHGNVVVYDTGFPSSRVEHICLICGKTVG